jgi:hypothetical protein
LLLAFDYAGVVVSSGITTAINKNPGQGASASINNTGNTVIYCRFRLTGEQLIAKIVDTSDKHKFVNILQIFI